MSREPLVSVLIPTHNRREYIVQAIRSVLDQDYTNMEIVVVDDGSDDDTRSIVEKLDIRYFYQEHGGIAAARNACIGHAGGEYIAWLDSDDMYAPGKISAQAEYLEAHPEAEIVFSRVKNLAESGDVSRHARELALEKTDWPYIASSMCRRGLLKKCGPFDTELATHEDTDMLFRMRMKFGANLSHFVREPLYIHRLHSSTATTFSMEQRADLRSVIIKNIRGRRVKKTEG